MFSIKNKGPGEYSLEQLKQNLAFEEECYEDMQGYLYLKDHTPLRRRRRYNNLSMMYKVALKRQRLFLESVRKHVEWAECQVQLAQQS